MLMMLMLTGVLMTGDIDDVDDADACRCVDADR